MREQWTGRKQTPLSVEVAWCVLVVKEVAIIVCALGLSRLVCLCVVRVHSQWDKWQCVVWCEGCDGQACTCVVACAVGCVCV